MTVGTNTPKSYRIMFKFWLDVTKDQEATLADYCEAAKEKRRFTRIIREGLSLMMDLQQGKTEVLRALFPGIVEAIKAEAKPPTTDGNAENLAQALARLEKLMLQNAQLPAKANVGSALKLLPAPTDDDPDLIPIKIAEDTSSKDISANFLRSLASITGDNYGIPAPNPRPAGNAKKMEVPQFAPPTFDDDDDEDIPLL